MKRNAVKKGKKKKFNGASSLIKKIKISYGI
jgi:hypothetical protein